MSFQKITEMDSGYRHLEKKGSQRIIDNNK